MGIGKYALKVGGTRKKRGGMGHLKMGGTRKKRGGMGHLKMKRGGAGHLKMKRGGAGCWKGGARKSALRSYRRRGKTSKCRKKGPAVCRSLRGCKYASKGKKRSFCRKTKNSRRR